MRLVDTRAYVGMLRELVEQGKEVRMVISAVSYTHLTLPTT